MIEKAKQLWNRYYEQLTYLIFGGLTTLLNIVLGVVFREVGLSTTINTLLDNILCILFAYFTNRRWVFKSRSSGKDAVREFGSFVTCRLGTMLLDVCIMWLGVDLIGVRFISDAGQGIWFLCVKVFSNILVIVLNYVFSKLIIFKKK